MNFYSSLISSLRRCTTQRDICEGMMMHATIIKSGFYSDIVMANSLISIYTKCGEMHNVRQLFEEMPAKSVATWTTIISGYANAGSHEEAMLLFSHMSKSSTLPNHFTYSSIISVFAEKRELSLGRTCHANAIKSGFSTDIYVANSLIDLYAKCRVLEDAISVFENMDTMNAVSWTSMLVGFAYCGLIAEARQVFVGMPKRTPASWGAMVYGLIHNNRVQEALELIRSMPQHHKVESIWNALISGCTQHAHFLQALEAFKEMQGYKCASSNRDTLNSILPACGALAMLNNGRQVHEKILTSGFGCDVCSGNSLLNMYAKCGRMEDATMIFERMQEQDVVSWSSIIGAHAMHGLGHEAIRRFEEMLKLGFKPNHVTILGVLSACCHGGLVDEGRRLFADMVSVHGIVPGLKHYGCMVDLLGRHGLLDQVWQIITSMPMRPDSVIWVSLLSSCRLHGNLRLGEVAARRLLELDPRNSACYVQLSNLYADLGMWEEVHKVRKMMKDRSVKRYAGCSWIEVNNNIQVFVAEEI